MIIPASKLKEILFKNVLNIKNSEAESFGTMFGEKSWVGINLKKINTAGFKFNPNTIASIIEVYKQIQSNKKIPIEFNQDAWNIPGMKPLHTDHMKNERAIQERWNMYYLNALVQFGVHFSLDRRKILNQGIDISIIVGAILDVVKIYDHLLLEAAWEKIFQELGDIFLDGNTFNESIPEQIKRFYTPSDCFQPESAPFFAACPEHISSIREKIKQSNCAIISGQRGCGKYASAIEFIKQNKTDYSYIIIAPFQQDFKTTISNIPTYADENFGELIQETSDQRYERKRDMLDRLSRRNDLNASILLLYDAEEITQDTLAKLRKIINERIHIMITTYKSVTIHQCKRYLVQLPAPSLSCWEELYHHLYPADLTAVYQKEIHSISDISGGNFLLFLYFIRFHKDTGFYYLQEEYYHFKNALPFRLPHDERYTIAYHGSSISFSLTELCQYIIGWNTYDNQEKTLLSRYALFRNENYLQVLGSTISENFFQKLRDNSFIPVSESNEMFCIHIACIFLASGTIIQEIGKMQNELLDRMMYGKLHMVPHHDAMLLFRDLYYYWPLLYDSPESCADALQFQCENLLMPYLFRLVSLKFMSIHTKGSKLIPQIENAFLQYFEYVNDVLKTVSCTMAYLSFSNSYVEKIKPIYNLYVKMWYYKWIEWEEDTPSIASEEYPLKRLSFALFRDYVQNNTSFSENLNQFIALKNTPGFSFELVKVILFMLLAKENREKLQILQEVLKSSLEADNPQSKPDEQLHLITAVLLLQILADETPETAVYEHYRNAIDTERHIHDIDFLIMTVLSLKHSEHAYLKTLSQRINASKSSHDAHLWEQIVNHQSRFSTDAVLRNFLNTMCQVSPDEMKEKIQRGLQLLNQPSDAEIQCTDKDGHTETIDDPELLQELGAKDIMHQIFPNSTMLDILFDF